MPVFAMESMFGVVFFLWP